MVQTGFCLKRGNIYGNILFSIGERISPVKQMEVAESILQRAKLFRQFYVNSYHKICNKYDQNA